MADNVAANAMNGIEGAKEAFKNMIKDKNKWLMLYLILIIIFIVWLLIWYVRNKLMLKETNNANMDYNLRDIGGSGISGINSGNPSHRHKLRDYYVASSYNSCCGGNTEKDFVDMMPLRMVIGRGARLLDFEIYSLDGSPVIAAGPEGTKNGKFCLKGTYNSLPFKKVMQQIRMRAFSGGNGGAPNPDDPLILNFRIKTSSGNIYSSMANTMRQVFGGMFLPSKYNNEGQNISSGIQVIPNIPLLDLKRKIIVCCTDPNMNFRGTEFHEFVNISGKGKKGGGMPFAKMYKNIDIVQTYDSKSLVEENKKFLAITMPDFSTQSVNPPAPIHHKFGCQWVMMNYSNVDQNFIYYNNFFKSSGAAFRLKPDHLRYFETVIKEPKKQDPRLSMGPKRASALGGAYKPMI